MSLHGEFTFNKSDARFKAAERRYAKDIQQSTTDLLEGVPDQGGSVDRSTLKRLCDAAFMGGVITAESRHGVVPN
jgi:hypothetical protein